ncbi:MAG: hypothetical protein RLZZ579_353 [Actinomycetota bacterium]
MLTKEYRAWNTAIFETIFNSENAGQPVYLDLDDEALEGLLRHRSLPQPATKSDLIHAVKDTLDFSKGQVGIFKSINQGLREWSAEFANEGELAGAPPLLPFLAITVLAAEKMGSGDHAGNAYYKHLFEILGVEDVAKQNSLQNGYMKIAEYYWDFLNRWLTLTGGIYGSKSAFSITHRYIGLPISQALIRDVDRKKLPRMFSTLMLNPGALLDPREMEQLFGLWLQREDSQVSHGLRNLWNKESARQRISEVLCGELQSWDGTYSTVSPGHNTIGKSSQVFNLASTRLTLQISRFPSSTAYWGLALHSSSNDLGLLNFTEYPEEHFMSVESKKGLQSVDGVSQEALRATVASVVELSSENGEVFRRVPKNLVALQFDPDIQRFVEVEQISLGQDVVLLVQNSPVQQARLLNFLKKNARVGWKAWQNNATVPQGWILIEDVQILSVETDDALVKGLEALVPKIAGTQLLLSGGVKIPGSATRSSWLKKYGPEIRALSQTVSDIRVELSLAEWHEDSLTHVTVAHWVSDVGSIFASCRDLQLTTGEYKVSLFEKTKLVQVREFQIVDASNHNALALRQRKPFGHIFDGGLDSLFFALEDPDSNLIEGFVSNLEVDVDVPIPRKSEFVEWLPESVENASTKTAQIVFSEELPKCYSTGAHYWQEDNMCQGTAPFVLGTCNYCRRKILMACSSNDAKSTLKKLDAERRNIASLREVSELEEIEKPVILEKTDWASAISLVIYAVHGTYSSLCAALTPLSSKNFSPEKIVETMYLMGVIELVADDLGRPKEWAIVTKQLIRDAESDTCTLAGAWDASSVKKIEHFAAKNEIEFTTRDEGFGFGDLNTSDPFTLGALISQAKLDVKVCDAADLAKSLPVLSSLIRDTRRTPLPGFESFEKFDLDKGSWEKTGGLITPGALRLHTKLGVRHFYVSPSDLEVEQGISCSATMAKYILANEKRHPLLWRGNDENYVFAPFGAIPPGLYTRALVSLCLVPPKAVRFKGPGSTEGGIKAIHIGPHYVETINKVIAKLES